MAKYIASYSNVKLTSLNIGEEGTLGNFRDRFLNKQGHFDIYESEHRKPGKRFIILFIDSNEGLVDYIKTSPGDEYITDNEYKIVTHDGKNTYKFDISQAVKRNNMEEREENNK